MSIASVSSVPAAVSPAPSHKTAPPAPPPPTAKVGGTDSDGDNDGSKGTLVNVMA